jgi:hypothetical protein
VINAVQSAGRIKNRYKKDQRYRGDARKCNKYGNLVEQRSSRDEYIHRPPAIASNLRTGWYDLAKSTSDFSGSLPHDAGVLAGWRDSQFDHR